MSDTATAGIGHNQPPPYDAFKDRVDALITTADKWIKERPTITDREIADKAEGFIDQITKEQKAIEAQVKVERAPHDTAIEAIRGQYGGLFTRLKIITDILKPRLTSFLAAERDRIAAERAARAREAAEAQRVAAEARKAAEAAVSVEAVAQAQEAQVKADEAMAARDAAIVAKPAVKSDFSTRARTLRKVWKAEITDFEKALQHYKAHADVLAVVTKLAGMDARSAERPPEPPGVKFTFDEVLS